MTHVDGGGVPAGTQLNGIYEIERRVAIGGMGEVYIGRVIQTGDKVAIKMILPEHANNEIILDLFRREASTLHNLYHEAIVRYYVFSVDPVLNRPYLSMEYAGGPSLGERLRDGGPLTEQEMTVMRRRVAGGLHAAHKLGIIHRDISPDNIILVDGDMERAKIIDFGIAKSTATSEGTLIGSGFAGKLNYVSPEQLGLEGGDVTAKSDIYSLGLVFAEAVIGRPLPMGGSQVDVIEKRRTVPDLSQVPEWIRPLIDTMVQPRPFDRPSGMLAVAEWTPSGGAAAAALASRPVHPRDRRRQQETSGGGRRKGTPWLLIAGGGAVAAAAAATLLLMSTGSDPQGAPGDPATTDSATTMADGALAPASDGALAPAGTLVVAGAGQSTTSPTPPAAPGGGLAQPAGTDGAPALNTGGGGAALSRADAPSLGRASGAGTAPTVPQADADPTAGSREPTVATDVPGSLAAPGAAETAVLAAGGNDRAPSLGQQPVSPALAAQGGAGGLPTVPPQDRDPTADAPEPSVATGMPGSLLAPAIDGGATSVAQSGGAGLALPRTGAVQRQQPAAAGSAPVVASIPSPQNQPPTVESAAQGPLSGAQGQALNVRLGSFFDEEGPSGLTLRTEGAVPNGLSVRMADGGVAQLYGTPAEFGDYEIRIAAVDPQGLVSQAIPISLRIATPTENKAVRDYILTYDGGDCFMSRPMVLGPQQAQIEVFAAQDRVEPVIAFDSDFKRDMGFEASIGMRPISAEQCPLIHALDQVGPQALDNSLLIELDRDELASGDRLSGKIRGGEGASLFLYDHLGGLTDLSQFVETRNGETGFAVPVTASGPQILIAAHARDDAGVAAAEGLDAMLGAAQRGQASLALGFFVMK